MSGKTPINGLEGRRRSFHLCKEVEERVGGGRDRRRHRTARQCERARGGKNKRHTQFNVPSFGWGAIFISSSFISSAVVNEKTKSVSAVVRPR